MLQLYPRIPASTNRLFLMLLLSLHKLNIQEGTKLFLSSCFCLFTWAFLVPEVRAQIVPDATLPVNSLVTPQGNTNVIEGGTRAGGNLFHSFREFSVPTGTEAFFNNGLDVRNIFSRVTGKAISNIDGLIKANGTANLFFLNPNGIIFGPNAKLNIGGSFLASTANSIKFVDGIEFSATNPQTTSLLTINVPIGLQYGANPQEIRIQGKGQESGLDGISTNFDSSLNPLEVPPGKSLTIVGGNVILDGGILQAPGGRVELGAVGGEGTVGLNADGSLTFPDSSTGETPIPRADVIISNKSGINVLAAGGGSITIISRNLDISGRSLLTAGIAQTEGSANTIAGDIQLNTSEATKIESSRIENILNPSAKGNSGNIKINTGSLSATENAQLSTSTYGQGNAGRIVIAANDFISFTNGAQLNTSTFGLGNAGQVNIKGEAVSFKDSSSGAFSNVEQNAQGNAGDIVITAKSLSVTNRAQLGTSTFGMGKAGQITIESDTVSFDGNSYAFSSVAETGRGDAGGILIQAKSLSLTNGAVLTASTFGKGDAGQITIESDTVSFDGFGDFRSGAFSIVTTTGKGNAGGISITAKSLSVTNAAILNASTSGIGDAGQIVIKSDTVSFKDINSGAFSDVKENAQGNAGGIDITAKSLSVTNGAALTTNTSGIGNAGKIIIESDNVSFDGDSYALSNVTPQGQGDAGGIFITAKSLSLTNGAGLTASTFGKGNAGQITIESDQVSFDGFGDRRSGAFSSVATTGKGNAGGISITAKSVSVTNGAILNASTSGIGNAGQIVIKSDTVSFQDSDSGAFSDVKENARGNAGGISITAKSLSVTKGALLGTSTFSKGNAGIIFIEGETVSFDGSTSGAYSTVEGTGEGNAIGIGIIAKSLFVTNGAALTASTFGKGDAGQIVIKSDTVFFEGGNSGVFSDVKENAQGDAGGISITAKSLAVKNGALLGTSTFSKGNAGIIFIDSETVSFDGTNSGAYSTVEPGGEGNAIGIGITANSLSVTNGARLTASTFGIGKAGQIIIKSDTVSFDGFGERRSGAFSNVEKGGQRDAGGIEITAKSLSVTNGAQLGASTFGIGKAGEIVIKGNTVSFDAQGIVSSGAFSNVEKGGQGDAGGIEITAKSLSVNNGAQLGASTFGIGKAGRIIIKSDTVSFDGQTADGEFSSGASSSVAETGQGDAGGISITAKSLSVTNGAQLGAGTFGIGNAGQITIKSDTVSFDGFGKRRSGAFSTVEDKGVGDAGGISISTKSLSLTNGAVLSTKSVGNGKAGVIEVLANSIRLSDEASIFSNTEGGEGNINLRTGSLILRRNSSITTNSRGTNNIGGNITIATDVLAALENSSIQANSEDFRGGRVTITTQGNYLSADSEITATGAGGNPELSGVVEIITPNVDPNAGLVNLPENVVDSTSLVASSCRSSSDESSAFVVTGRGGLPSSPNETLLTEATWVDLRPLEQKSGSAGAQPRSSQREENYQLAATQPIMEAQGWIVNAKGEVVLVAEARTAIPYNSKLLIQYCHDR